MFSVILAMLRPLYIGVMGGPKAGKTHLAGTLFTSKHVAAERVLYLDNHGSTDAFDFPQYSAKTPWGVKHISPDDPEELYNFLLELRRTRFVKKQYPYDAIVLDDWSEFAQADIEERLGDEPDAKTLQNWGTHGRIMRAAARLLLPAVSHAHHIAIFQAAQMPDPLEARPQRVEGGQVKFTSDTRKTRIRPFLQGSFASWLPYKLDGVFYQYMEVNAERFKFYLQLVPTDKVAVLSRWLHHWVAQPRLARKLENPTFDALYALLDRMRGVEGVEGIEPVAQLNELEEEISGGN